jgi:hypothetical protein
MKLLLLPACPRLIPDAVETLFINLMRDKTISPKVPQGVGVDAGAGSDQDHKRYDLLSARGHVAGRVGFPDMVNIRSRGSQNLPKSGRRQRSGCWSFVACAGEYVAWSEKGRIELLRVKPFHLTQEPTAH